MAKKTYRVTGVHAVFGTPPGSTFQADLPADQETRLVERGSVTRVRQDVPSIKKKESDNG